jgi:hypothetical protein
MTASVPPPLNLIDMHVHSEVVGVILKSTRNPELNLSAGICQERNVRSRTNTPTKRRDIMAEQQGNTTMGPNMVLQEATVQAFKTSLRGALLCPGDAGYDAARTVYNTAIDGGRR